MGTEPEEKRRRENAERMERLARENASYTRALLGVADASEIGHVDERTGDMVWKGVAPPREICFSQYIAGARAVRDGEASAENVDEASFSGNVDVDIPRDGDALLELLFANASSVDLIMEVFSPGRSSDGDDDIVIARNACPSQRHVAIAFGSAGLNVTQQFLDRPTYRLRFFRADGVQDVPRQRALGYVIATYALLPSCLRRPYMKFARLRGGTARGATVPPCSTDG